jgi:hypothetical protein
MISPRSEEIKLGTKKPLKLEEAKRCQHKPTMGIKRTALIRCGGCPDRANCISPPCQGGGLNSCPKIGVTLGHEEEELQAGVT